LLLGSGRGELRDASLFAVAYLGLKSLELRQLQQPEQLGLLVSVGVVVFISLVQDERKRLVYSLDPYPEV